MKEWHDRWKELDLEMRELNKELNKSMRHVGIKRPNYEMDHFNRQIKR